jgi:hypothetical protein
LHGLALFLLLAVVTLVRVAELTVLVTAPAEELCVFLSH